MKYAIVGSGPSFQQHKAMLAHADRVVTCNAGIESLADPYAYVVSDPVAIERWRPQIEAFARGGGKLVQGRLQGEDHLTPPLGIGEDHIYYARSDEVFHGRSVGVLAARWAITQGASELLLFGMDGYAPGHRTDMPSRQAALWAWHRNLCAARAFLDIQQRHGGVALHWFGESVVVNSGILHVEMPDNLFEDLDLAKVRAESASLDIRLDPSVPRGGVVSVDALEPVEPASPALQQLARMARGRFD